MALKLRRRAEIITKAILPQTTGAVSFKRVLGSTAEHRIEVPHRISDPLLVSGLVIPDRSLLQCQPSTQATSHAKEIRHPRHLDRPARGLEVLETIPELGGKF